MNPNGNGALRAREDAQARGVSTPALRRLAKRHRAEMIFRAAGAGAIAISLLALVLLMTSIAIKGWPAFREPVLTLDVHFDPKLIDPDGLGTLEALKDANYSKLIRAALQRELGIESLGRRERRTLSGLMSIGAAYEVRAMALADPSVIGESRSFTLPLSDEAAMWVKGQVDASVAEVNRSLDDKQLAWLESLSRKSLITTVFNARFFSNGDSREPELAGVRGAFIGSLLTLVVTLACCLPIGVGAAIYLEEFAPKGRLSDLIEVNINNLAAVPSVVFGLLGLAVFLNLFNLPRSAPLVGGLVLSLMTLPTVIIAARSAFKSIPPSIREAAMAIGASPIQVVLHHLLPLATPGIMTGTIVGMARALGETAPLLMIGMVAFVADIPSGLTSPSTVLPVQIYLWADSPERGFEEKTSAAILVLLAFLILMNLTAIVIRRRFERRW